MSVEQSTQAGARISADQSGQAFANLLETDNRPQTPPRLPPARARAQESARRAEPTEAERPAVKAPRSEREASAPAENARQTLGETTRERNEGARAADSASDPGDAAIEEPERKAAQSEDATDANAALAGEPVNEENEAVVAAVALLQVEALAVPGSGSTALAAAQADEPPVRAAQADAGFTLGTDVATLSADVATPAGAVGFSAVFAAAGAMGEPETAGAIPAAANPFDARLADEQAQPGATAGAIATDLDKATALPPSASELAAESEPQFPAPDAMLAAEAASVKANAGPGKGERHAADAKEADGQDGVLGAAASDAGNALRVSGAPPAPTAAEALKSAFGLREHPPIPAAGHTTQILQARPATSWTSPEGPVAVVPVEMLGVEIAGYAQSGRQRFDIRLDPPELGHVHVRLDVDRDGYVTSRLVVEKAETLDLLRRDAPQLERALQDAGLKTDAQTMQFLLRDQGNGQQHARQNTPATSLAGLEADAPPGDAATTYVRLFGRAGALDIRV